MTYFQCVFIKYFLQWVSALEGFFHNISKLASYICGDIFAKLGIIPCNIPASRSSLCSLVVGCFIF